MWRRHWVHVIPFFAYPLRRMIYTTNSIESLNAKLHRSVRIRGHFPNDEAAELAITWIDRRSSSRMTRTLSRPLISARLRGERHSG